MSRSLAATPRRVVLALACTLALVASACADSDPAVNAGGDGGDGATTTTVHPDDGHHDDGEGGAACDVSLNPIAYYRDAELAGTLGAEHEDMGADMDMGDMDHGEGKPDADPNDMGDMDHGEGTTEGTAEVTSTTAPNDMSGGLGEVDAAFMVNRLNELSEAEYDQWLQSLNPNRDVTAPDDTGQGGHLGPQTWTHMTDAEKCEELQSEIDAARAVAEKYPKASDATAAGYHLVAPYLPGIASHWMKFDLTDGEFDVNTPEMLLYDGNSKDANLVGLSYWITKEGDEEPTVGFTGDNDHYHRHIGLCVKRGAGVIGDSTTTKEECESLGGIKDESSAGWMSHAWVVPGCESPWGVFSAQNPLLDAPLGNASGQGEACSGSVVAERWNLEPAPAE